MQKPTASHTLSAHDYSRTYLQRALACLLLLIATSLSAFAAIPADHDLTTPPALLQETKNAPATLEKVRLQLKWFTQFQFAGYFAAIEQGYYAEEGLDVEINERILEVSFVDQVVSGDADFGVGDSGLLSQYAQGEPIIALAAIFQHNPLVFFTLQDSGIISPYEMIGKRIMSDIISANEAPVKAMLTNANITEKDYILIPHNNEYNQLTLGKVDVISGYLTDQPYFFKERGVKINTINPQHYGIDFYGDILFTSQQELTSHPGRAERFRQASIKGWRYALEHTEEIITLLHDKYNSKLSIEHLRSEAEATKKLILHDVIPLGQIEPLRLKSVADAYASSGFNRPLSQQEVERFIYKNIENNLPLSIQEQQWLSSHPSIRVGIDRDFAPYEWIDQNGQYSGLTADYMTLLEQRIGVRFDIIKDKSWFEILTMAQQEEVDMIAGAVKTPRRAEYLTFSTPYKITHAVIIDNGQGDFIGSLNRLAGKSVAVEEGYFVQEALQRDYPNINIKVANSTFNALTLVAEGKADAYVGDAGSANYTIKKNGLLSLRFSGQTEYNSQHSVAVTKNNPELTSIITKAMASITEEQADEIFNRWLGLTIEQGIQTTTVLKYSGAILLLLLLIGYWVYRLRREIGFRKAAEQREQARSYVLVQLSQGASLFAILELIAKGVEQADSKMLCSILLSDTKKQYLLLGAAPSLPAFYNDAVDGLTIGDGVGSCGTAAFRGERVIVENTQTHPYWAPYKELAAQAQLGSCWSQPVLNSEGQVLGTFAIYHRKPTQPSEFEIQLIESYASLTALVIETCRAENEVRIAATAFESQEGILVTDANKHILRVNRAFCRITGYSAEEVLGKTPSCLSSGKHDAAFYNSMWKCINKSGYWEGEIWNKRKNGEVYPEHLAISAVNDPSGNATNYVATLTDITLRKEAADKIEHLAYYDPLTHLPNRRLLLDRLDQAIISSSRQGSEGALLFLDLDHFKTLNDTLGHDVGDILLIQVAQRLRLCVREGDSVARLGGDEFVIILEDLSHQDIDAAAQTEVVAQKILFVLSQPYQLASELFSCTVSIGATLFNNRETSVDELLKQADIAMYQAKKSGRNTLRFFDQQMQEAINVRVDIERELKKAIQYQQFELYYQIQVNKEFQPLGAEALIRWLHPERGLIPPLEFIPLAEEIGLIIPIGQWVLETACAQLSHWANDPKTSALTLSINVSSKQFQQGDFVSQVQQAIQHHQINPSRLKLELTESLLLDNIEETITSMSELGTLGVQLSLDDFGTGYSSLQYLKRLPLYQLKIDQSFVRDLTFGSRDQTIVRTIIAMAESLHLNVIAEGVETHEQLQCLFRDNCTHFQGYLFSKPVPIDKFMTLIAEEKAYTVTE